MSRLTPWDDADLLRMLELDAEGLSSAEVAERFPTRNPATVRAKLNEIKRSTEATHHDGTMPPRWWLDGLRAQRQRGW